MRKVFLILMGFVVLASCQQNKLVHCSADVYNAPGNIAFYGFNASDLDTLVVSRYLPNDSFTQKIYPDTIMAEQPFDSGGYVYANTNNKSFMGIDQSYDIGIYIPAVNKTYNMHAVYSSQTQVTWTDRGECGTVGTFVAGPEEVIVNGNDIPDTSQQIRFFFIQP